MYLLGDCGADDGKGYELRVRVVQGGTGYCPRVLEDHDE